MAEKLSRKELKEPDAFMKAGSKARSWLQQNVRVVVIGSVLALLVVGGVALADYFRDRGQESASQELGAKLKLLERPVSETATTTGEDAPFKTEQEKEEALARAMAEVRASSGRARAAGTAALIAAGAQLRLKKYDEALLGFADYLKAAGPQEPMRAAAMEGQGYAHEGKGELDLALASFEQLERDNKTDFLAGMGLYHRGRILTLQNKKEDAAKAFSDVKSAHPGTEAARLAEARLGELKAQGVELKAPEPAPKPAGSGPDAG
ncbi:MAG TPA: tetratricopeptide repeat protein [Myxococcales bacterium]|nr:tetratricopeptide repeat protein [Myxococcales bacterium]